MFEDGIEPQPPSVDDVHAMAAALARVGAGLDDAARVDMLRALEVLACTARGAQAVVTADFDRSQRAEQVAAGVPAERVGQGIAAQVALARRESPHRGWQHLGLARVLADEMPHTQLALSTGRITEWKATVLARETACLSRADRAEVDRQVAGDLEALEAMGTGGSTDAPAPWPTSSTRSRRSHAAAAPRPTGESRCGPCPTR